ALLLPGSLLDGDSVAGHAHRQGPGAVGRLGAGDDGPAVQDLAAGAGPLAVSTAVDALAVPDPLWAHGAFLHAAALSRLPGFVLGDDSASRAQAPRRAVDLFHHGRAVVLHALPAGAGDRRRDTGCAVVSAGPGRGQPGRRDGPCCDHAGAV